MAMVACEIAGPAVTDNLVQFWTSETDVRILAARDTPELCRNFVPQRTEGTGNAGRKARPQPRAQR